MLAVFRSELDRVKEKDTHCPVSLGQVVCTCVKLEDLGSCLWFSSDAGRKENKLHVSTRFLAWSVVVLDSWHEPKPQLAESFKEIMWPYPQQWHQNCRVTTRFMKANHTDIKIPSRYCNDVPSGGFDRNIKSFNISLSRRLVPKIRRLVTFSSNALPSHGEVVTSLAFDFRRRQRAKFWTHCAARCSDGFGMFWAHLLNPTAKFNWRNNIFIHRRRACFLLLGLSWIDAVLLSILHGMFSTWHLWTAKYHPFSPLDGHGVVMALP